MKTNATHPITSARRARTPLLVAALAMLLPACGGSSDAAEADAARASIQAIAPSTLRDACEILTADDVATIVGGLIEAQPGEAAQDETSCEYGEPDSGFPVIGLTIHWRGGKELWEAWGMGRDIAAQVMADPAADSISSWDPLAGIGDGARYNGVIPSLVLAGDVLLEFQLTLLTDARARFPALATTALSRL